MLGGCWFETKFGEGRDSKVAFRSTQMDVGGVLPITLDVVEVGLRRGLGMLEIEGYVAWVGKRLRGWDWFCDFA